MERAVDGREKSVSADMIAEYDPRDHPAQLVRRVHQRAAHLFTQNVQIPHLSATQFVALVTLLKEGPMLQSQLGGLTSMDPSTTTVVVRKLEKDGLIEKRRSENDLRASMISLTPAGEEVALMHIPVSRKAGEDLLSTLTPIEQGLFLELLRKLLDAPGKAS